MGVETGGLDDLESLIASGKISADADVTEIAAFLAGSAPASKDGKGEAADGADADGKQTAKADGTAGEAAGSKATDDNNSGDKASDAAQGAEPEGPIVSETGRTIPFGVLKGTREQLKSAQENLRRVQEERETERAADRQRIADLESQLAATRKSAPTQQQAQEVQDIADRAGVTDAQGNQVDVTKIDVSSLRGEFPAPVVDIIESLQKALVAHETTIQTLRSRDAERAQQEDLTEADKLQADIDAVPWLAKQQASDEPHLWNAAIAMDKSLRADPTWADKPRHERFQEIARRFGASNEEIQAPALEDTPAAAATKKTVASPAQVQKTVEGALKRAQARSTPTSLTDLPAGSPAAQSEAEAIGTMDVTELAAKFANMTPAQQEAYLAKHA